MNKKSKKNRRDIETKNNLSAQFRPILTISCDSDFIDDNKFGMSKHKHFYYQNTIGIFDKEKINEEAKRIVISLELLNIGRGEASDLTINSTIISDEGEHWESVTREYKEITVSNGIKIMFCKELDDIQWEKYAGNLLRRPILMLIKVEYKDLVGYRHTLSSTVSIIRLIYMKNGEKVKRVLVLNPYDTMIENETSIEDRGI